MGPTYVATLQKEGKEGFCVVIINMSLHINLDDITIFQARNNGVLIERIDNDVCITPIVGKWDEVEALRKRDVIEFCLLSNGFYKLFAHCDIMQ